MSVNGGIVSAPIGLHELASMLGSALDVGSVCTSDNVKIWSKIKPQAVKLKGDTTDEPLYFATDEARDAAFLRGRWGLDNIPYFTDMYNMIMWMTGSTLPTHNPVNGTFRPATSWTWRKPTIYRMLDFDGYDHNAGEIVGRGAPEGDIDLPYAGDAYFKYPLAFKNTEITIADLSKQGVFLPTGTTAEGGIGDASKLRLGLVIIREGASPLNAAIITSANIAQNESGEVSFTIPADKFKSIFKNTYSASYRAFLFLGIAYANDVRPASIQGEIMPLASEVGTVEFTPNQLYNYDSVGNISGLFYPFTMSVSIGTITVATDPTMAISARISGNVPNLSRTINISYTIENKQSVAVYVTVRIELITNGIVYQTVYPEGTDRKIINPNTIISNPSYQIAPTGINASQISNLRLVIDVYQSQSATTPLGTVTATCVVTQGDLPKD